MLLQEEKIQDFTGLSVYIPNRGKLLQVLNKQKS